MSDFPIALHGERVTAVVIGGGSVGTRKALALVEAGARVRVVSPDVTADLAEAERGRRLSVVRESYRASQLDEATLVIAATDSREVNAQIAVDANSRGKLVNITDFPDEGNFHTMALHRSGDVTIAVTAGGVPGAAARIRDAIAERFDARYGRAVSALRGLRSRLIAGGDQRWRDAAPKLIADDFCSSVEDGSFTEKVDTWR
ncbi:MAG: cobalt-precorrin hydrolase / cobalt-factor methyltransferase / precorrin-3B [Gemmatimonadaceae bacterium]|nr:cobalt-precorrin hydrolase / cobalt-factor methyltransferase / precorrin-3B [Gemmatimonadaceae bacterium]